MKLEPSWLVALVARGIVGLFAIGLLVGLFVGGYVSGRVLAFSMYGLVCLVLWRSPGRMLAQILGMIGRLFISSGSIVDRADRAAIAEAKRITAEINNIPALWPGHNQEGQNE